MPDVLWPIFRQNRHLLHDLPALAAAVIQLHRIFSLFEKLDVLFLAFIYFAFIIEDLR
jgi:hypothetical protein